MARTNGPALSAAASSAANPKFPQFTGVLGCELRVQRRPSTDRFASVLIDSEVRTSVPPTLTNFGIGTLVSARGGDKPAEPRHHQNRPFVADPRQHVADRAAVRGQMLVSRFHRCAFLAELRGYLFAPSYDLSPRDSTCSAQPIMRRRCRALP